MRYIILIFMITGLMFNSNKSIAIRMQTNPSQEIMHAYSGSFTTKDPNQPIKRINISSNNGKNLVEIVLANNKVLRPPAVVDVNNKQIVCTTVPDKVKIIIYQNGNAGGETNLMGEVYYGIYIYSKTMFGGKVLQLDRVGQN